MSNAKESKDKKKEKNQEMKWNKTMDKKRNEPKKTVFNKISVAQKSIGVLGHVSPM